MRKIKFLSTLVLLALLLLNASIGKAGGYDLKSQCYCPSTVQGDSWLNWWGMSDTSWGCTDGVLYLWDVDRWLVMTSNADCDDGSSGCALAHNEFAPLTGNWRERGKHIASFFSGTKTSYGYCTCPP